MSAITEPGVYPDLPNDVYHADPVPEGSLSSSGARKLLPPSCPAKFRYEQDHGRAPKATFDFGHAAHKLVLGTGPELVEVDADDWRTKAAKQERDEARDAGAVPLLSRDYQTVQDMAQAIREHPVASFLFNPDHGRAEQSLFWRDPPSGVMLRARLDWLPNPGDGRMIVADYKTAVSAEPSKIERTIVDYGYHQQADWYLDGVLSLGLADDAAFVFVVQEKTAPYLVTVVEPDRDSHMWARVLNTKAIDTYRTCRDTGRWPGYADDVLATHLPRWTERAYEDARDRGDYETENHQ